MSITYSENLRQIAAARGKDLFACGFAEAKGEGFSELIGPMDRKVAEAIFCFAYAIHTGKTPSEAFASIDWPAPSEGGQG